MDPPELDVANKEYLVHRRKVQEEHADAWLSYIYHYLAEHRADIKVNSVDTTPGIKGLVDYASECPKLTDLPCGHEDGSKPTTPKMLPPGRLIELFEFIWLAPHPLPLLACCYRYCR